MYRKHSPHFQRARAEPVYVIRSFVLPTSLMRNKLYRKSNNFCRERSHFIGGVNICWSNVPGHHARPHRYANNIGAVLCALLSYHRPPARSNIICIKNESVLCVFPNAVVSRHPRPTRKVTHSPNPSAETRGPTCSLTSIFIQSRKLYSGTFGGSL